MAVLLQSDAINRWTLKERKDGYINKEKDNDSNHQQLNKTASPLIPEPLHRVGPKGVSSGFSFRKLPDTSLQAISDICYHYEKKCSGKYEGLGSRYVKSMSKEILSQVNDLAKAAEQGTIKFRQLEGALQEWNDNFRDLLILPVNSDSNKEPLTTNGGLKVHITPSDVKTELLRQKSVIDKLRHDLEAAKEENSCIRATMKKEMNNHVEAFRVSANEDQKRLQTALENMKRQYEEDISILDKALHELKNKAKKTIEELQSKAKHELSMVIRRKEEELSSQRERFANIEQTLKKNSLKEKKKLEKKMELLQVSKVENIEKTKKKLNREHKIHVAKLQRNFAIRIQQARLDTEQKRTKYFSDAVNVRSSEVSQHNCDSNRTKKKNHVTDQNDDVHRNSFNVYTDNTIQIMLQQRTEECDWLKSRVKELEGWVETLSLSPNQRHVCCWETRSRVGVENKY